MCRTSNRHFLLKVNCVARSQRGTKDTEVLQSCGAENDTLTDPGTCTASLSRHGLMTAAAADDVVAEGSIARRRQRWRPAQTVRDVRTLCCCCWRCQLELQGAACR
jgi:hypothetical protein